MCEPKKNRRILFTLLYKLCANSAIFPAFGNLPEMPLMTISSSADSGRMRASTVWKSLDDFISRVVFRLLFSNMNFFYFLFRTLEKSPENLQSKFTQNRSLYLKFQTWATRNMKKFTVNDTRHNENYLLRNTDKNDSGRLETKTNEYCEEKIKRKIDVSWSLTGAGRRSCLPVRNEMTKLPGCIYRSFYSRSNLLPSFSHFILSPINN